MKLLFKKKKFGVRNLLVFTSQTPNPESLKFFPDGKKVLTSGTFEFDKRNCFKSPLAKKLFAIDNIKSVFFTQDFITVTKSEDAEWHVLKPLIFEAIMNFYNQNLPVIDENTKEKSSVVDDDDEVIVAIKELLDTKIRPMVQEDGGDVMFHKFNAETGVVYLRLQGSCTSCPSSTATLKGGIENMMLHYIPEVTEVKNADEDEDSMEMLKRVEDKEKQIEEEKRLEAEKNEKKE